MIQEIGRRALQNQSCGYDQVNKEGFLHAKKEREGSFITFMELGIQKKKKKKDCIL